MIAITFTPWRSKALLLTAVLCVTLHGMTSAQTAVTKAETVDRYTDDLIQRLSKDKDEHATYSYTPSKIASGLTLSAPSLNALNLVGKTYAVTVPRNKALSLIPSNAPGTEAVKMPTLKPDMNQYNMPVKKIDPQQFSALWKDRAAEINGGITIADAPAEVIQKIANTDVADLELVDITLVPAALKGQTLMMITLTEQSAAAITFTDGDGKKLWEGKTDNGKFTKTFAMPANGEHYLVVKQNGKIAVKKLDKIALN